MDRYSEADKAPVGPRHVSEWAVPYWLVDSAFATMLLLLGLAQEGLGALFSPCANRQHPCSSHWVCRPDGRL